MSSKCGEHHYGNITKVKMDQILKAMSGSGSTVSGNNPWDVDVHQHGIKLQGSWNEGTATLSVIVTDKNFYVPCQKIWDTIDPLVGHISSLNDADVF